MFCKHKWETVSETVLPSSYEQMGEDAKMLQKVNLGMFIKKHILVLKCTECGKIYKSVEES